MILTHQQFLLKSLSILSKEYFIFITNKETKEVYLIDCYSIEYGESDTVCCKPISELGEVILMDEKYYSVNKGIPAYTRNTQNTCPIATPELQELLDNNYVLAEFCDGSQGWITYGNTDREKYDTPEEEVCIAVYFGNNDLFLHTYSSHIKKILRTVPKKVN